MIRVYSNHNRGFGEAWLEVNLPEINAGWWTDTDDEPISRALLTDKVRFHIETKHIPDGKKIPITILDYDGILNPDDEIVKQSITISGNRGYVELELPYRWLVHIDKDNGDCIELYVKCKLRDVEYTLPKSGGKYLRLYNIGYLAEDDCRVRVRENGNIEFWPEHFGFLAQGEWKQQNYPYIYEGKVYTDSNGQQHLGLPRTAGHIRRGSDDFSLPGDFERHSENLRNRDLPEMEDNTPKLELNNPPTRSQRSRDRRAGGIVNPPAGLKGGAAATLVLDLAIMAYDAIAPISVYREENKINEHRDLIVSQIIEDINTAYRSGWMARELSLKETSQLINVILYGESNEVSGTIYELGKYIYKYISNFKKVE